MVSVRGYEKGVFRRERRFFRNRRLTGSLILLVDSRKEWLSGLLTSYSGRPALPDVTWLGPRPIRRSLWPDAREQYRDELVAWEGESNFAGLQRFLACVHRLSAERRLSRC